jgi:dephospho-CoA kinase
MQAQLSREQRLAAADSVIDNSGSLADLDLQVQALHAQLAALATSKGRDTERREEK